jgi:hypothetical protein
MVEVSLQWYYILSLHRGWEDNSSGNWLVYTGVEGKIYSLGEVTLHRSARMIIQLGSVQVTQG